MKGFLDVQTWFRTGDIEEAAWLLMWNPVILARSIFDQKYSGDGNRVRNMLRTKRIGAKHICFAEEDDVFLERLAKNGKPNCQSVENSEIEVDTVSWVGKALGSRRNPDYHSLIDDVAARARNGKASNTQCRRWR